jgi:hypothetical protein
MLYFFINPATKRSWCSIEIEIAERCFPLVISLLGMEEMPDFPIFKVPVCNVLNKKGNRKKGNKAFELVLKVYMNE